MLMSDNTVLLRGHQNVGHIPYQPFWLLLVRIAQFVLATVILGLSAYSGGGYYFYAGYGIGIFSFVWTLLFLLYIELTIFYFPAAYNKYAHLVLECLSVIFWLSTFASLAVVATYSYVYSTTYCYGGYCYKAKRSLEARADSSYAGATKAAAALGAFEWVLFVASLIAFGIYLHRQRRAEAEARVGGAAPAPTYGAPIVEEHKMQPVVNQHPVDPRYAPQGYPQQQTYPQQSYPERMP